PACATLILLVMDDRMNAALAIFVPCCAGLCHELLLGAFAEDENQFLSCSQPCVTKRNAGSALGAGKLEQLHDLPCAAWLQTKLDDEFLHDELSIEKMEAKWRPDQQRRFQRSFLPHTS